MDLLMLGVGIIFGQMIASVAMPREKYSKPGHVVGVVIGLVLIVGSHQHWF